VRYSADQYPLDDASVQAAIAQSESDLVGNGRLLIRKSGTEPLVRVMAESENEGILNQTVDSIVAAVENAVAK
jgi:phosphoglucosamine mutase